MCLDKGKGGLGVKSLSMLNKALLCKWSWCFANEREALWNQVIRGKYAEEQGGWCSRDVREGYGVGLWKAIKKLEHIVSSRLSFVVGNSQRVSFWKDIWCGATPLCVSFPSLFTLADPKEAWVKDVWNGSIGVGSWSPRFTRSFNDWEMDEVEDLLLCLCGQKVILEEEDRVWWMKTKDEFSRQSHFTKP